MFLVSEKGKETTYNVNYHCVIALSLWWGGVSEGTTVHHLVDTAPNLGMMHQHIYVGASEDLKFFSQIIHVICEHFLTV